MSSVNQRCTKRKELLDVRQGSNSVTFSIIENYFTVGISVMISIGNSRVLIGYESGVIKLFRFTQGTLVFMQNYIGSKAKICDLACFSEGKFISTDECSEIRIWDIGSGNCVKSILLQDGSVFRTDSIAVLPLNLLAISGFCSPDEKCFDVWDLDLARCIHSKKATQRVYRCLKVDKKARHLKPPDGVALATTAEGRLVVTGNWKNKFSVWHVNRLECFLICTGVKRGLYSMAVLPTGDIVTGHRGLDFYTIRGDEKMWNRKHMRNTYPVHGLHPVVGYKILIMDSSQKYPLKLWNYLSSVVEVYWDTRNGGNYRSGLYYKNRYPYDFTNHIVLEREGVVLGKGNNKLAVHQFEDGKLHFSKNLAEIRKNARILSQACRTKASYFEYLPKDVVIKIAVLSAGRMNEYEKEVSEDVAWNYFCRPLIL